MTELEKAQARQIAALHAMLLVCRNHIVLNDDEGLAIHSAMIEVADKTIANTEAAAVEYKKRLREEVLEDAIESLKGAVFITDDPRRDALAHAIWLATKQACADAIQVLKEQP